MGSMLVHLVGQLTWINQCSDVWFDIISGCGFKKKGNSTPAVSGHSSFLLGSE